MKQLIIVESPTKARTIQKFLDNKKYVVKSSYGHVRDLPTSTMGIDIENGFEPKYVIPKKAKLRVADLKELAKDTPKVILATDEDREGEAIAWHLIKALGLDKRGKTFERIAFHEITKKAVDKALESPRKLNENLVNAQQARRILDRLVGYELSPFLWKKIKRGLSAGRVQSVALRLIVEKEREIENFKPQEYWEISVLCSHEKGEFEAALFEKNEKTIKRLDIKSKKEADVIKKELEKGTYSIKEIQSKVSKRNPPAPYTTSTLQQDANNTLGWSAKQTMRAAQELYEGIKLGDKEQTGLITYMRTDSKNLSMEFMLEAKKCIKEKFGEKYILENPRLYKKKTKGAQEAHEAIRPTDPRRFPEEIKQYLSPQQFKLYRLIWKRAMATQMQEALINTKTVIIAVKAKDTFGLKATGASVDFDGYLALYPKRIAQYEDTLPPLEEKESLKPEKVNAEQKFTQPPARFSEATLVKILEAHGIGRPSTYAPTISTIIDRKYVEKDENRRLYPLEIGFLVSDLLVKHFKDIVDYEFTAEMEKSLDDVAEGEKEWVPIVKKFYEPFHKTLSKKSKEVKKEDVLEKLDKKCPECGSDLIVKFGRFGKFIACTKYPDCKYTEKTQEEKKFEEENAGELCDKCGSPMIVKYGRFGAFLGCSNYPECKNIKPILKKTGVICPKCGGDVIERKSKKGRTFYGCSNYPKCDFSLWNKPTGEKCPKCSSLLVFSAKNTISCSSKECDYKTEQSEKS